MPRQAIESGNTRLLSDALRNLPHGPRRCRFANGDLLIREQEKIHNVFLIETGWVLLTGKCNGTIERHSKWWSRRKEVPLTAVSSGGLLGFIPVIMRESALYSAVARGPCVCSIFDRPMLERALANIENRLGTGVSLMLLAGAVSGIGVPQTLLRFPEVFLLDPLQRVEHLLWSLTQSARTSGQNGEVRLEVPLTRDELGALVHLDGKTFSRLVTTLSRTGRLRLEGRALILLDRDGYTHASCALDPAGVY